MSQKRVTRAPFFGDLVKSWNSEGNEKEAGKREELEKRALSGGVGGLFFFLYFNI